MKTENFAALILSHGRPGNVITYKCLRRHGYTGKIYIIVDDQDASLQEYKRIYGDEVIVFNKKEAIKKTDTANNFSDYRAVVFARNIVFDISRQLGLEYFIMLDDDYQKFQYRFDDRLDYGYMAIKSLDRVLDLMVDFQKKTGVTSIAMAQGGDFIGGSDSDLAYAVTLRRKAMNTFICNTKDPFAFLGIINEDVTAYVRHAISGKVFFTVNSVAIVQKQTQTNPGGLTEIYLQNGTYIKSFYTVMYAPSCVKVKELTTVNRRMHHKISWNNAVPCIIREEFRKV